MNKTALITGASSGIGYETALYFAKNGYNLIISARRREKLEELKYKITELYKTQVEIITADLSLSSSAFELFSTVTDKKIKVDVLINNAGFGYNGDFIDTDTVRDEDMLQLNIISLTKLTKLFAKEMVHSKSGTIINIASTAAFQPVPGMAVYAATKSYVLRFTEAISYELRNSGVKIVAVCPGPTESEFSSVAGMSGSNVFQSAPSSAELAKYIFESLNKGSYSRIHGLKNKLLSLPNRLVPVKLTLYITNKIINH